MHEHHTAGGWELAAFVIGGGLLAFVEVYLFAVISAARRGRGWPWWRTACAVLGAIAGVVAIGPLGAAGHRSFEVHMWGHLLLGMAGPLLLVLSAPVTALLRGLPVGLARRLSWLLSTPYARVVGHPVVAAALNIGGLWLLYTTALHTWMHASPLGHLVVHLHVLLAGWVFTASMLQVDPAPHGTSHRLRAGVLIAFLALHSILSKHIYANPPAGVEAQQAEAGAQLMYYGGDYIDLVLIALFCLDWYRRSAPRRSSDATSPTPTVSA